MFHGFTEINLCGIVFAKILRILSFVMGGLDDNRIGYIGVVSLPKVYP